MGQILSQPVTEKASESGKNQYYAFGVSSMQGWRVSMEDAHAAELEMGPTGVAYFGVYDGHGGEKTAQFAGEKTHELVKKSNFFAKDYKRALTDGFLATDAAILEACNGAVDSSGCAATACLITPQSVICANAGDSRTVLGRLGTAKSLSFDHKPDNEGERSRITNAGGFVDGGRVNSNLALSRAIGDFSFKKSSQLPPEEQVVTACPDIIEHPLGDDDEFVLLACDGIWDCMHSQEVIEFVRRGIADKVPLQDICELLMEECLAPESDTSGIGCDNMTVCIVALLNGQTLDEWYAKIAERVANGQGPVMARSTAAVRAHIESRAAQQPAQQPNEPAHNHGHAIMQQLFGPDGGRLDPSEATSLLSRLGIRFLGAEDEEVDVDSDYQMEHEHESDTEPSAPSE